MRALWPPMLVLACGLLLVAAGSAETGDYRDGRIVTVEGRLRVVGNEPHTRLAVHTDDGKDFYLPADVAGQLWSLQNRRVKVRGRVHVLGGGSGDKMAFTEYELTDVKVLSP